MSLAHPLLLSRLAVFYPSTCTVQRATVAQSASGEPSETWADRTGYVDIACAVSPVVIGGRQETRTGIRTYGAATYRIALAGSFPDILSTDRVTSDGKVYDILAVDNDAQTVTTSLTCQIVGG